MDGVQRQCVPELDAAVCCATTSGQKTVLVRTPSNGFDSGYMLGELGKRVCVLDIPHKQLVIVAS